MADYLRKWRCTSHHIIHIHPSKLRMPELCHIYFESDWYCICIPIIYLSRSLLSPLKHHIASYSFVHIGLENGLALSHCRTNVGFSSLENTYDSSLCLNVVENPIFMSSVFGVHTDKFLWLAIMFSLVMFVTTIYLRRAGATQTIFCMHINGRGNCASYVSCNHGQVKMYARFWPYLSQFLLLSMESDIVIICGAQDIFLAQSSFTYWRSKIGNFQDPSNDFSWRQMVVIEGDDALYDILVWTVIL